MLIVLVILIIDVLAGLTAMAQVKNNLSVNNLMSAVQCVDSQNKIIV